MVLALAVTTAPGGPTAAAQTPSSVPGSAEADVAPAAVPAPAPQAVSGQSALSVGPALIDSGGPPGSSFERKITLANITDAPVAVRSVVEGLATDEPIDPIALGRFDTAAWFTVVDPDFLLLGRQSREITVRIAVPSDAEPGGHYATVFFEAFTPEQAGASANTVVNARIGVVTLLTVPGDIREELRAAPVQVESVQFAAGPTALKVRLRNTGNVHVLPLGEVEIASITGKRKGRLDLPVGVVLPGTERTYDVTWEHGPRIGLYRFTGRARYGTAGAVVEAAQARVVLLPLIVLVPMGIVVLIIGSVLLERRQRQIRRARWRFTKGADDSPATETTAPASVVEVPAETEVPDPSDPRP